MAVTILRKWLVVLIPSCNLLLRSNIVSNKTKQNKKKHSIEPTTRNNPWLYDGNWRHSAVNFERKKQNLARQTILARSTISISTEGIWHFQGVWKLSIGLKWVTIVLLLISLSMFLSICIVAKQKCDESNAKCYFSLFLFNNWLLTKGSGEIVIFKAGNQLNTLNTLNFRKWKCYLTVLFSQILAIAPLFGISNLPSGHRK